MPSMDTIDFDDVVKEALDAAKRVVDDNLVWKELDDIVENITEGLKADANLIAKRKLSGAFNEMDARLFLEDQKMLARIRLRSSAIIGMAVAEQIWNAVAEVFRKAIKGAIGWTVL